MNKAFGTFAATVVAGLIATGTASAQEHKAADGKGTCTQKNACNGKGACKTATNECKGHNTCKNHAFETTSADCKKAKGTWMAAK